MARSSKLSAQKAPQEPTEKLLAAILDDALKAAAMPFDEWWVLSRLPLQSLAIPIDAGREHRVAQVGVDAAHRLTEQEWRNGESYRQTIARSSEFDKLSFRAIGQTLSQCQSHLPVGKSDDEPLDDTFFAAMAAHYARILEQFAQIARRTTDRHIPCHLFHTDQAVPAFSVGPVQFLPRSDWIARYVTNAAALAYILEVELRKVRFDDFRDQALGQNSNRDLHEAWDVLASLRDFGWVATVRLEGHDLIQSHQKASIIVGLAIDAIGLRFQVEDARRLAKAGRQHLFSEDRLATSAEGHFLKGWSMQVPGLGSAPGALAGKMNAERPFLDAAGKVLQAYVQSRQTGPGSASGRALGKRALLGGRSPT